MTPAPRLTTLTLAHYDLGRTAVGVLFETLDRHRADALGDGEIHRVPMRLRARQSVAARRR